MRKYRSPFVITCLFITIFTICIAFCNMGVIVIRGGASLYENLQQKETIFAIVLSMKTAFVSTILCFLLAVPTAYMLTRTTSHLKNMIEVFLELTMSLPNIVIGLSMLILFSSVPGKMLKAAGFPVIFHTTGIVFAQLMINLPFAIKLSATAFHGVDANLEKVAGLLGAAPGRRFFTILLPLSRNELVSAVILVWSRALGEFGATLMLVGVTRMKTETLPGSIYLNVSTNNLGSALSSAFILLFISAVSLAAASVFNHNRKRRERKYVL